MFLNKGNVYVMTDLVQMQTWQCLEACHPLLLIAALGGVRSECLVGSCREDLKVIVLICESVISLTLLTYIEFTGKVLRWVRTTSRNALRQGFAIVKTVRASVIENYSFYLCLMTVRQVRATALVATTGRHVRDDLVLRNVPKGACVSR